MMMRRGVVGFPTTAVRCSWPRRGRARAFATFVNRRTFAEKRMAINLWSGPRCSSTSLMYAFAQRSDCAVVDEPLYAYYMKEMPEETRPYKDDLMRYQSSDGDKVVDDIMAFRHHRLHASDYVSPEEGKDHVFYKHMAKHMLPSLRKDFLFECPNIILIRDPEKILKSYTRALGSVQLKDTGLVEQAQLFDMLHKHNVPVPVVCNDTLMKRPEETLKLLCSFLGIEWDPAMLSWEAGGRQEDGCWAYLWYEGTHKRTGFGVGSYSPPAVDTEDGEPSIDPQVLDESMALYEKLLQFRISP